MSGQLAATYVDHMGSDLSVVRAAKVSFAYDETVQKFITDVEAEGLGVRSHEALIRYLANHNHWTPFAHTAITLRMSAPVPIRTQCFKHKQGFVENEESRRYISGRPEVFIPDEFRAAPEGSVKQGSGGIHTLSKEARAAYLEAANAAIDLYEGFVAEGICPEQARFVLPQGCMVNWYWTGSLSAYARFFKQRTDPHAQKEIQELAHMVGASIEPLFPVSWKELTK